MTPKKYNARISFISNMGDFSEKGQLFIQYGDAFWEWYGDPSQNEIEDTHDDIEIAFHEWFRSRILYDFETVEDNAEILPEHLDREIQSIQIDTDGK